MASIRERRLLNSSVISKIFHKYKGFYKINKELRCGDLVASYLLDQPTQETLSRLLLQWIASSMNQTRNFADVEEDKDELEENELVLEDC